MASGQLLTALRQPHKLDSGAATPKGGGSCLLLGERRKFFAGGRGGAFFQKSRSPRTLPSQDGIKCKTFLTEVVVAVTMGTTILGKGGLCMASVNWGKCHSATEAKAVLRHNCKDTRQATKTHSNKQLDTSKTYLNYGSREGHTYADACARYDARLDEVLSYGHTDKRAKTTMVCLEAPTPKDLPADRERAWFARFRDIAIEQLGRENFVGMWVHEDEVHDYVDPVMGEPVTSRHHAHMGFVAASGDGNEARLCGKELSSRANMVKLNNAVESMSVSEFGVHFMDGSKRKSRGKVEDLKRKSAAKLAELAAELERREARLDARERALDEREASLQERERKLKAAPAKSAAASPAAPRKSGVRSLDSIRRQTHASARTVDGYAGQGYEKGR